MKYNDLYSDSVYGPYLTIGCIVFIIIFCCLLCMFVNISIYLSITISIVLCMIMVYFIDRYFYYQDKKEKEK